MSRVETLRPDSVVSVKPAVEPAPPDVSEGFRTVGRSVTGADFVEKVKGSLSYADDWEMPGMLYGRVVRAQVPSARLLSIDADAARKLRGVVAVLTAADIPANAIVEEASGLGIEPIVMPVLAGDRIRYYGEPVALVAAETPEIAEEAAELMAVEYEDSPGVFDPQEALEPDAPRVHERGNTLVSWTMQSGDVDAALAEADVVVEGTYRCQPVDHAYMEPEAGVGWIDSEGVLTLRVSTQVIEHARQVARILAVPTTRVRVMGTYMGGGFGGKEDMTIEPYLALLVWKTRRSVKMVWSRQESLLARPKRHPFVMHYTTGATKDGVLTGQKIRLVADAGAYPLLTPRVVFAASDTAVGPYRVSNVAIEGLGVLTNNIPCSAMRGFGAMQVVFGYEGQMDRVAEAVGLSPAEVRERNFLAKGDRRPAGQEVDTHVALPEAMHRALDALGPKPEGDGRRIGQGFACNMQPYGRAVYFADRASCWIGFEPDGSLVVRIGVTDLGGGQAASLGQIASEILGVSTDRIAVHISDTALTPLAGGTFATRQLYMSGNATLKTARELREAMLPVACELIGTTDPGALVFADGMVSVAGTDRVVSLPELVRACEARGVDTTHLGTFRAETGEFDPRTGRGRTFPDYTFGCHAVQVAVDTDTGMVEIQRYVACHDVGRAINPLRVEGQIQGGAVMGIGYALSEEISIEDGVNMSSLFADYLIPAATDVPDIDVIVLESGEGKGPFGARGIGEPPIAPSAAAIASAVADAVGVRMTDLPLTPEKVLTAFMAASKDGQEPPSPSL